MIHWSEKGNKISGFSIARFNAKTQCFNVKPPKSKIIPQLSNSGAFLFRIKFSAHDKSAPHIANLTARIYINHYKALQTDLLQW